MSVEFSESLLDNSRITQHELAALFNLDNCRDLQKGQKVSVSLHQLQSKMKGVKGIAASLQSDIKVLAW